MPEPTTAHHDTRVGLALAGSIRMLRERSVVTLGLGAAVMLSLLSVCCGGLGLITTPWFMCELFAVQLALCTGVPVTRGGPFVSASLLLLGAVLMVSAVGALTLLGAGPELSAQGLGQESFEAVLRSGGAAAVISSVTALLLAAPWLYAPLILLEQRTRFDLALVESVHLVVERGLFASLRLSLGAHAVQASPLILAAALARLFDASQVALFALLATPLLCLSVPLGQGIIVWSYVQQRTRLAPEPSRLSSAPQRASRSERCARAWTGLMLLPIASLLLLELSLLRPSRVPIGSAPEGELIAELVPSENAPQRTVVPNTALEIAASSQHVRVVASDGGGVGDLPLRAAEPIARVQVLRVRDVFGIAVRQGPREYVTWVDRAGVRLDDDLRARLLDRVSPWQLLLFLCTLLTTGILSVPVLYALGRGPSGLLRARNAAVVLLPLTLACFFLAVRAVLGD
ncbi:MAG: hypothetical protein RL701_1324 [Pseudomonadota bacterium]